MQHYLELLKRMDCEEMAYHSTLNHHVDGMHYICLHRTPALTVKIYLIEKPTNPNSGYLVHPHSHRYGFDSTVLHGGLEHIRFHKTRVSKFVRTWDEFSYRPETRSLDRVGDCQFYMSSSHHVAGDSYHVDADEVHTLCLDEGGPVMIGLMQYQDEKETSELFLPQGRGPDFPLSERPTPEALGYLQARCLHLLGAI